MVARNEFVAGLAEGQPQIGLWISLASNIAAEVIAPSGYDWVLLDMEHSPGDVNSILGQLQVFARTGTTAIVRPDWNDAVLVKRLLDLGAPGLLFPMIQSAEEARAAVAATRYPPHGIRGVAGSTRANRYGRDADYFDKIADETAVLIQLETQKALGDADAITAVDGITGVFFGPGDIAADMGLLGQPLHDDVWAAIRPVARRLIDRGMPVGTLVSDPAFARELLEFGFSFVAVGSDTALLARGADALLARMRGAAD